MPRGAMPARARTPTQPKSDEAGVAARRLQEALALHRANRLAEAAVLYDQILEARPRLPDALHLRGLIAYQTGDHETAITLVKKAIAANKRDPAYHNSLGAALLALGRHDEAIISLRRAVTLKADYAEAHNNLGNAWLETDQPTQAAASYRRALSAQPSYPIAHNNLGSAFRKLGQLAEAEASYREALRLQPAYASALSNLGRVLHEQGRYQDALRAFTDALETDPNHAEAHANLGILLLTLGRLAEGFGEYEWRWQARGRTARARVPDAPLWDGSSLDGRTLFVSAEQGLGSAIQFVRYLPPIARTGGAVVLECERPLERLFASLRGIDLVAKGMAPPSVDVQAPLLSLPSLSRTDTATIPCTIPYLGVDPDVSALWRERLESLPGLRVGLVWSGNPKHENDRNRSMPAEQFAPLLAVEDVSFVSLQIGARERDLEKHVPGVLHDLGNTVADFADTAAIVMHLDLVVSVDTAVTHLAGALGRPVWLLVPFVPEWRWQLEREDSPWYPSFRLFRQRSPGDWDELMDRVGAALRDQRERTPA